MGKCFSCCCSSVSISRSTSTTNLIPTEVEPETPSAQERVRPSENEGAGLGDVLDPLDGFLDFWTGVERLEWTQPWIRHTEEEKAFWDSYQKAMELLEQIKEEAATASVPPEKVAVIEPIANNPTILREEDRLELNEGVRERLVPVHYVLVRAAREVVIPPGTIAMVDLSEPLRIHIREGHIGQLVTPKRIQDRFGFDTSGWPMNPGYHRTNHVFVQNIHKNNDTVTLQPGDIVAKCVVFFLYSRETTE